jgi:hypothetical protein
MMNSLSFKKLLVALMLIFFTVSVCDAQTFERRAAPRQNKSIAHKGPLKQNAVKAKGPRAAQKVQKKQAAKDKKADNDYKKFVKNNQKRSIQIQTPEVQVRMKQNIQDANSNYKLKKKSSISRTKTGGRKYR